METNSNLGETHARQRWIPRKFGLRAFLIFVTVLCIGGGWILNRTARQKRAIQWVKQKQGKVLYDFQYSVNEEEPHNGGPILSWIRDNIDVDLVSNVTSVHLPQYSFQDHTIESLQPLETFRNLENLNLSCVPAPDLTPLKKLTKLKRIYSFCSGIGDISPLAYHPSLEDITIYVGHLEDATPLTTIPNLKVVSLDRSGLEPEQFEAIKGDLLSKNCTILFNGSQISPR